jgi:hypothetical protein
MIKLWNKRKWIGGLLALLLLTPLVVRTAHIHFYSASETTEHHHHHPDGSACPVCVFSFFPFIEAEFAGYDRLPQPLPFEIIFYAEETLSSAFHSYYLRAPPVLPA